MTAKITRPVTAELEQEFAAIRQALRREAERTSLRAVAREVGMTPTGLRGVLDGATPYATTRARLRAWHFRWQRGREPTPAEADELVRLILRRVPDPERCIGLLLETVETLHLRAGVFPPPWVSALADRYRAAARPPDPTKPDE